MCNCFESVKFFTFESFVEVIFAFSEGILFNELLIVKIMQTFGGATPLMYACQQCMEHEVLNILMKNPYAVEERDRTLKTPLHYCAENATIKCAENILKVAPELVNAQDENGYCPLHLAVIAGNKHLMKLLITKGADINIFDNEGHSAVHWAIVSNEKEALEMIINAGANPSTPDIHGGYPLHYAVQMCGTNNDIFKNFGNAIKVVQTLLHYGVDVNVMDKDGRQPILWAASAGSTEAIIHLISAGARVDASDKDGLTALHCAASRGHTDTIETLITLCGGEVDIIDGNGCSPLFYAVTLGHADSTEILLRLGAQPNRQDRKGRTAAHCGAAKGQLETLKILQKHDGNLWIRNVKGDLPFHESVASGRKDLVLWFLSQNPEAINVGNNDGRCPLHIAAMYNNTEMIKILLDLKCLVNPVMRTSKGILMTPLNVALCKGHRSCGKFLQLHGGVPFSKVSKLDASFIQAVRISPSHDIKNKISEKQSPEVSPCFKILSPQNVLEEAVKENGEKKKILRRRKKKRNYSNERKINNDESDSEDSFQEGKNDAAFQKSNIKNVKRGVGTNFENFEKKENVKKNIKNKNLTTFVASTNIDSNISEESQKERTVHLKSEGSEEAELVKKSVVLKKEPKLLSEDESVKEFKNVSNLSPNDFPPTMQSITQLDSDIIEAEIDSGKIIIENERMNDESNFKALDLPNFKNVKERKESPESEVVEDDGSSRSSYLILTSPNFPDENNFESHEKIKNDSERDIEVNKGMPNNSAIECLNEKELKMEKDNCLSSVPSKSPATESIQKDENSPKAYTKQECKIQKEEILGINGEKKVKKSVENNKSLIAKKDVKPNKISGKKNKENEKLMIKNEKKKILGSEEENVEKNDFQSPRSISEKNVTSASENKASEINDSNSDVLETFESTKNKKSVEMLEKPSDASPKDLKVSENYLGEEEKAKDIDTKQVVSDFELKNEKLSPEPCDGPAPSLQDVVNVAPPLKENEIPLTSDIENKIFVQDEVVVVVDQQDFQSSSTNADIESFKKPKEKTLTHQRESFINFPDDKDEIIASKKKTENLGETLENENILDNSDGNVVLKNNLTTIVNGEVICANDKNISASLKKSIEDTLSDTHVAENFADGPNTNLVDLSQSNGDIGVNEDDVNKTSIGHDRESDKSENLNGEIEEKEKVKENGKSEPRPGRITRLCRRNRDLRDTNQTSVTQLIQGTIRKYHMERGIFHQLLELKRLQIRAGRANEQILVKRLVDEYERSRFYPGMTHFTGMYKFREFEKFLYDQLKAINRGHAILPDMKSYDDIDALSGILKKSRFRILNDIPEKEPKCACLTQRCHHTMYAYTTIPCSAYVANFRRNKLSKRKKESFFPRIDQSQVMEKEKFDNRHPTLELIQGSEKKVISLPQNLTDKGKKYYITFTIRSGQTCEEDDEFLEETKNFFKHRHANSV